MSDYRRWISYIYAYENGIKKRSAGYAKLELKDGRLTMTLHLTPDGREGSLQVCMYKCHAGSREGVLLGSVEKKQGGEGVRFEEDAADLRGSGLLFQEMNGLLLYDEKARYLISSWEDEPVEIGALQEIIAQIERKRGKMGRKGERKEAVQKKEEERAAENVEGQNAAERKGKEDAVGEKGGDENREEPAAPLKGIEPVPEKKQEDSMAKGGKAENTEERNAKEDMAGEKKIEDTARKEKEPVEEFPKSAELDGTENVEKEAEKKRISGLAGKENDNNLPGEERETNNLPREERKIENKTWKKRLEDIKKVQLSPELESAQIKELHPGQTKHRAAEMKAQSADSAGAERNEKEKRSAEKMEVENTETENSGITAYFARDQGADSDQKPQELHTGNEVKSTVQAPAQPAADVPETKAEAPIRPAQTAGKEETLASLKEATFPLPGKLETRLFSCLPTMYPFEHQEFERSVRMEPQDIGLLPREMWKYAGNSFLLHSYYAYHHILFVRKVRKEKRDCYLMLPGVYNPKEQHMAKLFGFSRFCPVRKKALQQGDFGYWYMEVQFPDGR